MQDERKDTSTEKIGIAAVIIAVTISVLAFAYLLND